MENLNNTKKQHLNYGSVWKYKDQKGLWLGNCLAEFIDNSISSFKNNLDKLNQKTLLIELKTLYKENGSYQVIITDNAFGMNEQELYDSILTYNNKNLKDSTSMNQYGIGLKYASFWIGDNLTIYSKNNNQIHKLKLLPENKKERNDNVDLEWCVEKYDQNHELDKYDSGTQIIIDCYENASSKRWTNQSEESNNKLKEFLGKKYCYYIAENTKNHSFKLELSFIYENEQNGKISVNELIEEYKLNSNPLVFKDIVVNDNLKSNEIEDLFNKQIKEDMPSNSSDICKKLFNLFINHNEVTWLDTIYLDESHSIGMKINFSLLKESKKEKSGLAILHNNRYIYFPFSYSSYSGHYEYWKTDTSTNERFLSSHDKWILMELDLQDIDGNENCKFIKPDESKSSLVFSDDEDDCYSQNNFNKKIQNYLGMLDPFICFLIDLKRQYGSKDIDVSKSIKKSRINKESIVSSINLTQDEIQPNKYKFKTNTGYEVFVTYINDLDRDEIFQYPSKDYSNKKIEVIVNKGSKYIRDNDYESLILLLLIRDWEFSFDNDQHKITKKQSTISSLIDDINNIKNKIEWEN